VTADRSLPFEPFAVRRHCAGPEGPAKHDGTVAWRDNEYHLQVVRDWPGRSSWQAVTALRSHSPREDRLRRAVRRGETGNRFAGDDGLRRARAARAVRTRLPCLRTDGADANGTQGNQGLPVASITEARVLEGPLDVGGRSLRWRTFLAVTACGPARSPPGRLRSEGWSWLADVSLRRRGRQRKGRDGVAIPGHSPAGNCERGLDRRNGPLADLTAGQAEAVYGHLRVQVP